MQVLLIEDDRKAARLLAKGLREAGFVVDLTVSGEDGEEKATEIDYDVIVLDLRLPGKNGLAVCRALRSRDIGTPILMLTALDSVSDRVSGLRTGADDYLTKPFAFDELLARIAALLRRARVARPLLLTVADLTVDPLSRRVTRAGAAVTLTPKEYAILEILMRHAGNTVSRSRLTEQVWGEVSEEIDNLVDVHVSHLRRKVDHRTSVRLIHTIRGVGYRLGPGAS